MHSLFGRRVQKAAVNIVCGEVYSWTSCSSSPRISLTPPHSPHQLTPQGLLGFNPLRHCSQTVAPLYSRLVTIISLQLHKLAQLWPCLKRNNCAHGRGCSKRIHRTLLPLAFSLCSARNEHYLSYRDTTTHSNTRRTDICTIY